MNYIFKIICFLLLTTATHAELTHKLIGKQLIIGISNYPIHQSWITFIKENHISGVIFISDAYKDANHVKEAISAIKKNINRINESINKNKFSNIEVLHTAVGDNNGTILLGSNSDWSPNYKINEEDTEVTEQSLIKPLDDLFNLKDNKIVMKIDVEGFEFEMLSGAKETLKNNQSYLQIEIRYENYDKIEKLLNEIGYYNYKGIKPHKPNTYADCNFQNY